jgi:hypothetical protein
MPSPYGPDSLRLSARAGLFYLHDTRTELTGLDQERPAADSFTRIAEPGLEQNRPP